MIGGRGQTSEYSLDCRFNRIDLVRKIQRIALYKDQVHLSRVDAEVYIKTVVSKLPDHSLTNIDPPYFGKGPGLYTSSINQIIMLRCRTPFGGSRNLGC